MIFSLRYSVQPSSRQRGEVSTQAKGCHVPLFKLRPLKYLAPHYKTHITDVCGQKAHSLDPLSAPHVEGMWPCPKKVSGQLKWSSAIHQPALPSPSSCDFSLAVSVRKLVLFNYIKFNTPQDKYFIEI